VLTHSPKLHLIQSIIVRSTKQLFALMIFITQIVLDIGTKADLKATTSVLLLFGLFL